MITVYNVIAGLGGGIIAIVSAIGLPFIRKIIFKLFESKVDERANKAISDHNAKNDTKIHVSKALFDLEQKAINNNVVIFSKISKIIIETSGMVMNDIKNGISILDNRNYYVNQNKNIEEYLSEYHIENLIYSLYIPENIDSLFYELFLLYANIHAEITSNIHSNDINSLNSFFIKILIEIDIKSNTIKKEIRKYYNNIKVI